MLCTSYDLNVTGSCYTMTRFPLLFFVIFSVCLHAPNTTLSLSISESIFLCLQSLCICLLSLLFPPLSQTAPIVCLGLRLPFMYCIKFTFYLSLSLHLISFSPFPSLFFSLSLSLPLYLCFYCAHSFCFFFLSLFWISSSTQLSVSRHPCHNLKSYLTFCSLQSFISGLLLVEHTQMHSCTCLLCKHCYTQV